MPNELETLEQERDEILSRHADELQEVLDKIDAIKRQELDKLKQQAADLGFTITIKGDGKPTRKPKSTRKPATCRTCRQAGLSGEGHTARSHSKWLMTQGSDIQAKLK